MKTFASYLLLSLVCHVVIVTVIYHNDKDRVVNRVQPVVHEVILDYRSLKTGISTNPKESCISTKKSISGERFSMVCFSTVKGEL